MVKFSVPPDTRTWAEIDLSAIRHNAGVVRDKIGPGAGVLAVVKANAYGHGDEEIARALADLAGAFGVANATEARTIAPLGKDILLLSPCLPAERREVVKDGFIATVSSAAEAEAFAAHGRARLNFKIDTGMGRIGCAPEIAIQEFQRIRALPGAEIHSISSHLPSADEDITFTRAQFTQIDRLFQELRPLAPAAKFHVLNSAGVLQFSEHAYDLVRPGLMLYGSAYPAKFQSLLRPALAWKTRILIIRDVKPGHGINYGRTFLTPRAMRTASLPVGYADGFPRQLSNHGATVLIGGKRCAVLGRVTMDQIVVDVTNLPGVQPGDEAVLIGRQGNEEILAREVAEKAGTIAWDIFTGLGRRVRKFYF